MKKSDMDDFYCYCCHARGERTGYGREFITSDEALSLQTTADGWEETEDKSGRMTLKKGDSIITVMHCGNGEELPERAVAEGAYAGVYEASVSTKNEVILITGSVTDMKDFEEMRETVESLKILKYDTRKAVEKESVQEEENLGEAADKHRRGSADRGCF